MARRLITETRISWCFKIKQSIGRFMCDFAYCALVETRGDIGYVAAVAYPNHSISFTATACVYQGSARYVGAHPHSRDGEDRLSREDESA